MLIAVTIAVEPQAALSARDSAFFLAATCILAVRNTGVFCEPRALELRQPLVPLRHAGGADTGLGGCMLHNTIIATVVLAILGCGIAGGVFFAFSTLVMRGLQDLPPAEGIRAMNAINTWVAKPVFKWLLFGTGLVCGLVAVAAIARLLDDPPTAWREYLALTAGAVYLLGAVLATLERSQPLNRALAAVDKASDAMVWRVYLREWVTWNHVRAAACIAACVLFVAALWPQMPGVRSNTPGWPEDCVSCAVF